jgi:hypothetical protein
VSYAIFFDKSEHDFKKVVMKDFVRCNWNLIEEMDLSYCGIDDQAIELFLKHGIKGIRYLDQRSREKGDGTYNFVIFDPSVIQIVSKNGEFVMSSKTPENIEV